MLHNILEHEIGEKHAHAVKIEIHFFFFVSKYVICKRDLPKFIALPELSDGILIAVSLVALIRVVFSPINFTEVSWPTSKTENVCQSLVYSFFPNNKNNWWNI